MKKVTLILILFVTLLTNGYSKQDSSGIQEHYLKLEPERIIESPIVLEEVEFNLSTEEDVIAIDSLKSKQKIEEKSATNHYLIVEFKDLYDSISKSDYIKEDTYTSNDPHVCSIILKRLKKFLKNNPKIFNGYMVHEPEYTKGDDVWLSNIPENIGHDDLGNYMLDSKFNILDEGKEEADGIRTDITDLKPGIYYVVHILEDYSVEVYKINKPE